MCVLYDSHADQKKEPLGAKAYGKGVWPQSDLRIALIRIGLAAVLVCLLSCTAAAGSDSDKKYPLSEPEFKALKEHIRKLVAQKRQAFEKEGTQRVQACELEASAALKRLKTEDPLLISDQTRTSLYKDLALDFRNHPDVKSYAAFPVVAFACEKKAYEVLDERLKEMRVNLVGQFAGATPELTQTFTLADCVKADALKQRIAVALCATGAIGDTNTAEQRFSRLSAKEKREILARAAQLLDPRRTMLIDKAQERMAIRADGADFPWPSLTVEDVRSRDQRIHDSKIGTAKVELLSQTDIPREAWNIPELQEAAEKLAEQWLARKGQELIHHDQLQRLNKLEQWLHTKPRAGDNCPFPMVPFISYKAEDQKKEVHFEAYYKELLVYAGIIEIGEFKGNLRLQRISMENEKLSPEVREKARQMAKIYYNETCEEYTRVEKIRDYYREGLTDGKWPENAEIPAGMDMPAVPGTGNNNGYGRQGTLGKTGSAAKEVETMKREIEIFQFEADKNKEIKKVKDAADKIIFVPTYYMDDNILRELGQYNSVPEKILRKLEPIKGQELTLTQLHTKMIELLGPHDYSLYYDKIKSRTENRGGIRISSSSSSSSYVVDEVKKKILAEVYGKDQLDRSDQLFKAAEAEAQARAEQIVKTIANQLRTNEELAREITAEIDRKNSPLGEKTNQIIHQFVPLDPERDFSQADPRLFYGDLSTELNSLAQEIVARLFGTDTNAEIREQAMRSVVRMLREQTKPTSKKINNIVISQVFTHDREFGNLWEEIVALEGQSKRITTLREGIERGMLNEHPELASIVKTSAVQQMIQEQADRLYDMIKEEPHAQITEDLKLVLGKIRFGQNGFPTRQQVESSKDPSDFLRQQIREQAVKSGDLRFQKYVDSVTFQNVYKEIESSMNNRSFADSAEPVESQSRIPPQPINPGQTQPQPNHPVVPAPDPVTTKDQVPPPPVFEPKRVECKVRISGEGESLSCKIMVEMPDIGYKDERLVSRGRESEFLHGVKQVILNMNNEIPKLVLVLMKDTKGVKAEFNITIYTHGKMLPMYAPNWLAKEMDMFFKALHEKNNLIIPRFDTWKDENTDEVFKLEELLKKG